VPVVHGAFTGTVAVAVHLDRGRKVSEMRSYSCDLSLTTTAGTNLLVRNDQYPPDSSRPLKFRVDGKVP
jgi:hypothetical protein